MNKINKEKKIRRMIIVVTEINKNLSTFTICKELVGIVLYIDLENGGWIQQMNTQPEWAFCWISEVLNWHGKHEINGLNSIFGFKYDILWSQ